nr:uncharacterized protein LOC123771213 [Procambarus clarkii]
MTKRVLITQLLWVQVSVLLLLFLLLWLSPPSGHLTVHPPPPPVPPPRLPEDLKQGQNSPPPPLVPSSRLPEDLPQEQNSPPPPHAAYRRSCYKYHPNLTAENTCCKMTNFSGALHLLHTCITRANTHLLNEAKVGTGGDAVGGGNWSSVHWVHWVLVGDSHIRYILGSFLTRFRSPGLMYRVRDTDEWHGTALLEKTVRLSVIHRRIQVFNQDINFRMTYIWDPYLRVLPEEMAVWERRPRDTPCLLIFGGALHWMVKTQKLYAKNGTEAAAARYREHIKSLRPHLTRLSSRTTVVFKLLDDLKKTYVINSTEAVKSIRNYVLYNKIAVQELSGTGVIIWDSTRPLSTDYAHHCIKNPEMQTPPYFYWKCQDLGHVGYILVDQYADMIINDFCNKHLNISGACL